MPRFLYLIFSHGQPAQIIRLAATITRLSPKAQIVIHHDPRGIPIRRDDLAALSRTRLIDQPIPIRWGTFDLTRAILRSTRWIMNSFTFDWLVVLSGTDYPLSDLEVFEARLSRSGVDAAVDHFPAAGYPQWPRHEMIKRYQYSYFPLTILGEWHRSRPLQTIWSRLPNAATPEIFERRPLLAYHSGYRNFPKSLMVRKSGSPFHDGFRCYGGSCWMNLSRGSVETIHHFLDAHPTLLRYYETTLLAEESLFHTILANDTSLRIQNDSYRYIQWEAYAASPRILRESDYPALIASGQPFARKFEVQVDAAILDRLDARLFVGH